MADGSGDIGREFLLRFRCLDHAAPAHIRLRHLLKAALRSHGLRCLDAIEVPAQQDGRQLFNTIATQTHDLEDK